MFRSSTTLPIAFRAAKQHEQRPSADIERLTRKLAGKTLRQENVIPDMIDHIKEVLDVDGDRRDT